MTSETLPDVSFKATAGQLTVDEAKGIVECFVAAIGNKDSVGDIVLPGAFNASLKRRKPRVVWGHNWNEPIGKVLEIYEVPSSDSRLPAKMRSAGVGGLYARVQFNLKSERGREAFSNVSFFGEEQEWSIGYKTLNADFDPNKQANLLKEVELYEVSPVLHGANQLTGTISIKSDSTNDLSVGDLVTWNSSGGTAYGKVVKKTSSGSISAKPEGPTMDGTEDKPALGIQVWKQDSDGEWVSTDALTVHRADGLRKIDGLPSSKSAKKEDEITSFGKSKWKMFDRAYAENLRDSHPDIWRAGGNIKGNDQYEILTKIAEQGGVAKTPDQVKALELREAWVARHKGDFRLPGVIAQIKWLAVGSRGEDHMKRIVADAVERKKAEDGAVPANIDLITSELMKKVKGEVKIIEVRDTQIDFEKDGEKWTIPYADLAAGQIAFAEPYKMGEEAPAPGGDKGPEMEKDVYSSMPSGTPSQFGTVQRGDDEDEKKGDGMGKKPHAFIMLLPKNAEELAAKEGMDPKELGVIIKNLGPMENWDEEEVGKANQIIEKWAGCMHKPVRGRVDSVDNMGNGMMVYRISAPELDRMRAALSDAINLGTKPDTDDDNDTYVPNMPIGMNIPKPVMPAKPIDFDRIRTVWGQQATERKLPWAEEGEDNEESGEATEQKLNFRQRELYESYEETVKKFGLFDQSTGDDGAHYVKESPFSKEGLICSNCVFFKGGRACEIVEGDIDPNAVCKFWIIPDDLIKSGEMGKKADCGCGCGGKGDCGDPLGFKASLTDIPGAEANSSISAEVLQGRGPRRGNLEKLLRYWRPIMKRKGGFRRCVAELMDHPELAPWKPLCAWLHHETTGKWPNEGNHHGGGKAGRAAKRVLRGRKTGWSDEYGIKSDMGMDEMDDYIVDDEDKAYAIKVLKQFVENESEFVKMVQNAGSWVDLDDDDNEMDVDEKSWKAWIEDTECVDCEKEGDNSDLAAAMAMIDEAANKVGRKISSANMSKLEEALRLLNEVVGASSLQQKDGIESIIIDVAPSEIFGLKELLDPIADFYGTGIAIDEVDGESMAVEVKSEAQLDAISNAFNSMAPDSILGKALGRRIGRGGGRGGFGPNKPNMMDLKPEALDPDAIDGDNDGIVQEGTTAQRPKTPTRGLPGSGLSASRADRGRAAREFDDMVDSGRKKWDPKVKDRQIRDALKTYQDSRTPGEFDGRKSRKLRKEAEGLMDEYLQITGSRHPLDTRGETSLPSARSGAEQRRETADMVEEVYGGRRKPIDAFDNVRASQRRGSGLSASRADRGGSTSGNRLPASRNPYEEMTDEELLDEYLKPPAAPDPDRDTRIDGSGYFQGERRRAIANEVARRKIGPFAKLEDIADELGPGYRERLGRDAGPSPARRERRGSRLPKGGLSASRSDRGSILNENGKEELRMREREAELLARYREGDPLSVYEREELKEIAAYFANNRRAAANRGSGRRDLGSGLSASRRDFTSAGANDVRIQDEAPKPKDYTWDWDSRSWVSRETGEPLDADQLEARGLEISLSRESEKLAREIEDGTRAPATPLDGSPDAYVDADGGEWYFFSEGDLHGWTGPNGETWDPLGGGNVSNSAGLPNYPVDNRGKPIPGMAQARQLPDGNDDQWIGNDGVTYEAGLDGKWYDMSTDKPITNSYAEDIQLPEAKEY